MPAARILVVDNESIIAKSIENRLKKAGYHTLGIAMSGMEAIQLSGELRPDLILMDIVMDDEFDGIEATARIHDFLDVPVIYITAHDDEEHLQRATQTEPYGYLIKPIETNLLRSTIEVALHKHAVEKRLKQQLQRLTATRTMDQAILSQSDLFAALVIFLQQIVSSLSVDAARILLLDPGRGHLEEAAALGFQETTGLGSQTELREAYAWRVVRQQEKVFFPRLAEVPELPRLAWVEQEGFVSYLGLPLISGETVKGMLEFYQRTELDLEPDWLETLEALAGQVQVALEHFGLLGKLRRTNRELVPAYDATIQGWSRALELRDQETQGHSQRVTEMTLKLAVAMNYPESKLIHVRRGALLHDIGKMGIPDGSLLKTGPLNPGEWETMRKHPQYAYDLLKGIPFLEEALEIPYCHHERWDGSGYPRGLKGGEIPLAARIFSVIDVWDALCSERRYQEAWPVERALEYIREQAGAYFDPQVVAVFLKLFPVDPD
jgi:response regulator RpfG family c-di-GMP phosphodiesterase